MKANKNLLKAVLATLILGLGTQLVAMESPKRQRDEGSEEEAALLPGETTAKKGKADSTEEFMEIEEVRPGPQPMETDERELWENQQGDRKLTLQSSDGQNFIVPVHTAQLSETLRNLIEDVGTDNPIPLPTVDGKTLATIVTLLPDLEWLMAKSGLLPKGTQHEPLPYKHQDELLYIPRAFQPQVNDALQYASTDDAVNLFLAANYLDIPFLLNGAASVLADRLIKRSNPQELLYTTKEESLNLRLKNLAILADKTAPAKEQKAAKKYFMESEKDFVTRIPRDLLQKYIIRHIAHRQCGITQEYSIADYIRERGLPELSQPKLTNSFRLELVLERKKLTSLFGIQLLLQNEVTKNATYLNLSSNCLIDLSLDPQGAENPFSDFINVTILGLDNNRLTHLDPQLFAGLENLESLDLSFNQLTDLNPQVFAGLHLRLLDLRINQFAHYQKTGIKKLLKQKIRDLKL